MTGNYKKIINSLGKNRIRFNEILSVYTSLKIGGPADLFFKASTVESLVEAVLAARNSHTPFFVLGGGTNILFPDEGFRGLVIKNETSRIRLRGLTGRKYEKKTQSSFVDKVYLEVDSGVSINRLVRFSIEQNLAGMEYFLGQPGTVGGAVFINAHNMKEGAFFADRLISARIYGKDCEEKNVPGEYFRFGYDRSAIQKTGEIVLTVTLELKIGNKKLLWEKAKSCLEYRFKTQPGGVFTCGCLFRNIKQSDAIRLVTPGYTCSAGFLLESAGLKGKAVGRAMLSSHHANFLINMGGATAADVLKLIALIKNKITQKYGLELEPELVIVRSLN